MWGWEEPQRDGCALDSTRTACREHTRSGHTAPVPRALTARLSRSQHEFTCDTCGRGLGEWPRLPATGLEQAGCSARHLTQRGCVGCMRALAAARRGSRGGASTERGVETEQRPGAAGAGAEAAAPHPAHGLLPSPVSTVLPRRGTHTWPQGCWPSVHTATGRQVSSVGDKRFLGRAGGDGKAGRGRSGAGTGQQ